MDRRGELNTTDGWTVVSRITSEEVVEVRWSGWSREPRVRVAAVRTHSFALFAVGDGRAHTSTGNAIPR